MPKIIKKPKTEIRQVHPDWVDPENRDPRWYIFNQRYLVTVPILQLRSMEDIKEFGVPVSGSQPHDEFMNNEIRTVMLPISDMIRLAEQGSRIGVVIPEDTKRIYEACSTYMEIWIERLERSLNATNAPLDDLQAMDRFAHSVYEKAKWHITDDFKTRILAKIRPTGLSNMLGMITAPIKPKKAERDVPGFRVINDPTKPQRTVDDPIPVEEEDDGKPKRTSLAVHFRANRLGGTVSSLNKPAAPAPAPSSSPTQFLRKPNEHVANMLGNNKGNKT